MRTFAVGDIHGTHKALVQCLQRSKFNYGEDRLIVIGDICDAYPETKQSIDELLKIKHLECILGNHDLWALWWATTGFKEDVWVNQGGENTILSYGGEGMPPAHVELLREAHPWFTLDNKLFVHGGFDPEKSLTEQSVETFIWDRNLISSAWHQNQLDPDCRYTDFAEIFLGHTPTQHFNSSLPLKLCNIWDLDTGAGWAGKLTVMDINTKEYWQSDPVTSLYPGIATRRSLKK